MKKATKQTTPQGKYYAQHLTGRDLIPGVATDDEAVDFLNHNPKLVPDHVYEIVHMTVRSVATRPHDSKEQFKKHGL